MCSRKSPKWISCKIAEVTGPLSYVVELTDGKIMRRHVDSIKRRHEMDIAQDTPANDPHPLATPPPDLSGMTEIPPSAPPIARASQQVLSLHSLHEYQPRILHVNLQGNVSVLTISQASNI